MDKWYMDCETCGFHGLPVTIQYAINDGPIIVHEIWREPIKATLDLIEQMMQNEVIGFNLAFDHFHIQKIHNTLTQYVSGDKAKLDHFPEDHINELGECEFLARDGDCVKPASALDMMLYFRKTELQIIMERDDMRVRRVPAVLAESLAKVLTKKIQLDPILFAGQKKWAPRFRVFDIKMDDGEIHPHLKDVVLRFRPGGGLKPLATHLLGLKTTSFVEVEVDKKFRPKEYGFAPFARAIGRSGNWKWSWPDVIKYHIEHWAHNEAARQYAEADVLYTRELHKYAGSPEGGDTNSILTCLVASCRWKGYKVDVGKLEALIATYKAKLKAPIAPSHVKAWINELLNPIERAIIWKDGTNKKALKTIIREWAEQRPEVVERAQAVLDARTAKKKIEILEKLRIAGRFHASFKVMGALTDRMSGSDKLNAQGIDKTKEVRGCFPLAFAEFMEKLLGGDMMSFEISIAEADYGDPKLREKLTTCEKCNIAMGVVDGRIRCPQCGGLEAKSFHALFGEGFFPELGYDGIMATKGLKIGNVYNPCKNGGFATLYGAQPAKLADTIGVSEDQAIEGYHRFWRTYEVAGQKRREVEWAFTSLYNEDGGPKINYKEPQAAIESLLGHKRYFVLENYLIHELFCLANDIPKEWKKVKVRITRHAKKGEQTAASAIRSALYGCAFGLQATMVRQAQNHRIQATGAGITKEVQIEMWKFQPVGVHRWMVRPMNIHDELQSPTDPEIIKEVTSAVYAKVESFRPLIPLIGIDFGELTSWSDK